MLTLYISRKSAHRAARKSKLRAYSVTYMKVRNADLTVDQGFAIRNKGR